MTKDTSRNSINKGEHENPLEIVCLRVFLTRTSCLIALESSHSLPTFTSDGIRSYDSIDNFLSSVYQNKRTCQISEVGRACLSGGIDLFWVKLISRCGQSELKCLQQSHFVIAEEIFSQYDIITYIRAGHLH